MIYGFTAYADPAWQNWVAFGGMLAMWAAWAISYLLTKRTNIELTLLVFIFSVILFETLETMLIEGTAATAVMGNIAILIYATLFSRRYMYFTAIAALASFLIGETARYFQPYPIKVLPADERYVTQMIFAVVLYVVIIMVLRRSQSVNEQLFDEMLEGGSAQEQVIEAANRLQPVVEEVTRKITTISNDFATQATEQAASTTEVNSTLQFLLKTSDSTASSAKSTLKTADETRQVSQQGAQLLSKVQSGFNEVVDIIEKARQGTSEFVGLAENIEQILSTNSEIANQIKILAVNAGIQAAKAGKYGTGFRVVAQELRGMIQGVDDNLLRSGKLLDEIRNEAKQNAGLIKAGADLLHENFDQLRGTGEAISTMSESVKNNAMEVEKIVETARKQEASIGEVTAAMTEIDNAASQLRDSAQILLESVEKISRSYGSLRAVLSSAKK
ncbi:MAG: hypothetical protein GY854_21940 [Deltaproteobacteria bacterium]|nr:hypothetical protein [Deltaproteobacteria bacterium]